MNSKTKNKKKIKNTKQNKTKMKKNNNFIVAKKFKMCLHKMNCFPNWESR